MNRAGKSKISERLCETLPQTGFTRIQRISFDDYEIDKSDWNESSYFEGRKRGLNAVRMALMEISNEHGLGDMNSILIVDDLNYLKSMRRELYALARDHLWSCLTIYVRVKLETAILRNRSRESAAKVAEATIHRMFNCIESPEDSNCMADKCSFIIDGEGDDK